MKLSRIVWLSASSLLLLSATVLAQAGAQGSAKQPNVLFFAVDDLRPDLGCYGNAEVSSPNIDRLAKSGLVFTRAYCQQAVCSPSRTSLLTGLRPDSTRVYDLVVNFRDTLPDVVTLPQHFLNNGYHTEGMGKIYHGGLNDDKSWSVPWRTAKQPTYALSANQQLIAKKLAAAKKEGLKGKPLSRAARGPATESADVPDNAYHDGAVADLAIESLGRLSKQEQPFFLAVGFIRPHLPFVAPKKYWEMYDRDALKLADNPFAPKNSPEFALTDFGELRNYDGIPQRGKVADDKARELIHGYRAATSYMDAQMGRVLAELERLGLADNTIVILWGDHGWKLGEHGSWCKHTNFELDAHVPLIIRAPGMKATGESSPALVEFVDIYPTLSELAGLPLPKHLEGTSFKPLLANPEQKWKTAAFSQYPRSANGRQLMGYSMRTDRYRFTQWVDRKDSKLVVASELYDQQLDPAENKNVADDAQHAKLVRELAAQAKRGWRGAKPKSPVSP